MTGALVILAVTAAFGLLLWFNDRRARRGHSGLHHHSSEATRQRVGREGVPPESKVQCCGLHAVCEKLIPEPGEKPEYFEDEELDRFAGRGEEDYSLEEADEFREVLTTLRAGEVSPWLRSLRLRGIALPLPVRDEVIMIIGDPEH